LIRISLDIPDETSGGVFGRRPCFNFIRWISGLNSEENKAKIGEIFEENQKKSSLARARAIKNV